MRAAVAAPGGGAVGVGAAAGAANGIGVGRGSAPARPKAPGLGVGVAVAVAVGVERGGRGRGRRHEVVDDLDLGRLRGDVAGDVGGLGHREGVRAVCDRRGLDRQRNLADVQALAVERDVHRRVRGRQLRATAEARERDLRAVDRRGGRSRPSPGSSATTLSSRSPIARVPQPAPPRTAARRRPGRSGPAHAARSPRRRGRRNRRRSTRRNACRSPRRCRTRRRSRRRRARCPHSRSRASPRRYIPGPRAVRSSVTAVSVTLAGTGPAISFASDWPFGSPRVKPAVSAEPGKSHPPPNVTSKTCARRSA